MPDKPATIDVAEAQIITPPRILQPEHLAIHQQEVAHWTTVNVQFAEAKRAWETWQRVLLTLYKLAPDEAILEDGRIVKVEQKAE